MMHFMILSGNRSRLLPLNGSTGGAGGFAVAGGGTPGTATIATVVVSALDILFASS